MDENNFLLVADATLQALFDQIEESLPDHVEADLESGVLTLSLEAEGEYVINRHLPNRQIWMSSPISGGTHFNYDEKSGKWQSNKDSSVMLRALLSEELRQITGVPFYFDQQ